MVGSLVLAPALAPKPLYPSGLAVLALVFAYSLGIWTGTSPKRGHTQASACRAELRRQWAFCATLSVFMVLPDWFLVAVLKTLRFPDDGAPRIGGETGVSVYMSMMWTLPLLWVLAAVQSQWPHESGDRGRGGRRQNKGGGGGGGGAPPPALAALAAAAALALLVFATAELVLSSGLVPLQLWHCTELVRWRPAGVALYVLPAEAILGAATLQAYEGSRHGGCTRRVLYAASVSALYTGGLALGYLFIESGARP